MKSIYKYVIILTTLIGFFTSCSDKYLDKISPNTPSKEDAWADPKSTLESLLTACYDGLQSKELYNGNPFNLGPINMDCISDNGGFFNWSGWKQGHDILMGTQTPSSGIFRGYWEDSYDVIIRCNTLIESTKGVKDFNQEDLKRYIAEAKVIRALIYNNLTMLYQDVPLLTENQSISNNQIEKTDKATIVKAIMDDLKESAEVLPKEAPLGRITKGAALALLGRVALYNEDWDTAIKSYKEVMTLGYSLYPDYSTLFTAAGQDSKEIIFSIRYEGPGQGEGSSIGKHWNTPLEAVNGTLDLADAYYVKSTGKRVADKNYGKLDANGTLIIAEPNPDHYTDRDPRLYTTLFVPGMTWNGVGGYGNAAASLSTIYVKKYYDPENTKNSGDGSQDFYVIRYAEVLLSLAEAEVQKGGYNYSEVLNLVNQVRERAGMPKVEDAEGITGKLAQGMLLDLIKHERRVELAFEGLRLFDLYRWKQWAESIATIEKERTTYKLSYEPRKSIGARDYIWPIPTSELNTNKKLKQHSVWK